MGNCASKPRKHRHSGASNDAIDALTETFHPDVDGKGRHLHMHATKSGRMLIGQDVAPMSNEHIEKMKTVLEEDPEAAAKAKGLMNAVNMGLQVASSGSPAFSGLLVVKVISASVRELKNPAVQLAVEDDKASGASDQGQGTGQVAQEVKPGEQDLHRQTTGVKVREFTWDSTMALPFVVVFSHAAVTITLRDRVLTQLQPGVAQGTIAISDLPQGKSTHSISMKMKGKDIGVLKLEINYNWLRGTRDDGGRISTTHIRINNRKLPSPMAVISHVSNVNHWLLSHDNIWAALPKDHPALKQTRKDSVGAAESITASEYSSKPELLKLPSSSEADSVTDGSSDMSSSNRAMKHVIDEVIADVEGQQGHTTGCGKMFQFACTDALEMKDGDGANVCEFKAQLASLFSLMNERMSSLEDQVARQQQVIMDLSYQVSAKDKGPVLPYISGKFGYGLGRPAAKRKVLLFANRGQYSPTEDKYSTMFLGEFTTDSNGTLGPVHVPESVSTTPGHYNVMALLPQDNTFARGSLFVLQPKTKCVLFDLDGTVTTGDEQVVAQFALNAFAASTDVGDRLLTQAWDQKSRAHARTLCRLWAAKGYQVIYLSGRQGSFYNLTQQWLSKHFFPPGPIHLTRTHVPTMPLYVSVGNFKLNYMESLKKKGFELFAAYGNTGTDVRAYEAAGIPKSRTFTIAQAAGVGGTQRVKNWTYHLKDVLEFPDASIPIPYVDLLTCSVPSYHRGKATKLLRQNLASATSGVMPSKSTNTAYNGKQEFRVSSVSSDDTDNEIGNVLEAVELDCGEVADMYEDGEYENDLEPEGGGDAVPPAAPNEKFTADNVETPAAVEDVQPDVQTSEAMGPAAVVESTAASVE